MSRISYKKRCEELQARVAELEEKLEEAVEDAKEADSELRLCFTPVGREWGGRELLTGQMIDGGRWAYAYCKALDILRSTYLGWSFDGLDVVSNDMILLERNLWMTEAYHQRARARDSICYAAGLRKRFGLDDPPTFCPECGHLKDDDEPHVCAFKED